MLRKQLLAYLTKPNGERIPGLESIIDSASDRNVELAVQAAECAASDGIVLECLQRKLEFA